MAQALHRAIRDALADSTGYTAKGILTSTILEATTHLDADESLLYRSVYTIFRALPDRLVAGTTLAISTMDLDEGVLLVWEGKERAEGGPTGLLGRGPYGDLVEIAMVALENFCHMRAGYVETYREGVSSASSFDRPPHVVRRVEALIPARRAAPAPPAAARPPALEEDDAPAFAPEANDAGAGVTFGAGRARVARA